MKELADFLDTVYDIYSRTSKICFGHPNTLLKLCMKDFYKDTYFISDLNCEEDKFIFVKDEQLKKELYKFCCEHEDRIFRGEKNERNDYSNCVL